MLAPLPSVHAATKWEACPERLKLHSDRISVKGPKFVGPQHITSMAADPTDPNRVAVSNGWEVWRTEDAGCTWLETPLRRSGSFSPVLTLVAHRGQSVRGFYMSFSGYSGTSVVSGNAGVYQMTAVGFDGTDWWESATPLPVMSQPCPTARACLMRYGVGGSLDIGYAGASGPGVNPPGFARTADGGRTWEVRQVPGQGVANLGEFGDFTVDPANPDHVVALANSSAVESLDGGETWQGLNSPRSLPPGEANVAFAPDPVIAVKDDVRTRVMALPKGSRRFVDTDLVADAVPLTDIDFGGVPPSLHLTAGGGVFRQAGGALQRVVDASAEVMQTAPTAAGAWVRSKELAFVPHGSVADEVPQKALRKPRPAPGSILTAGDLTGVAGGSTMQVGGGAVVPPGGSASVVVTAALGRQPRGIDVFFLMDTTGSMAAKIAPIAAAFGSVVDALNEHGVAARFGLAEYGDRAFRYRRHADLGTDPAEVQTHLSKLTSTGGDEFHYTSFYQLATGEGLDATDGADLPPGLQASFQPGSLHVLVHATDDTDQNDPSGPDEATALAALRARDIRHIGVYPYDRGIEEDVQERAHYNDFQMPGLRRYAEATDSRAPAGGLDCDGDDEADLAEGAPIACAIRGDTSKDAPIATLLTRVLLSLTKRQPIAIQAVRPAVGVDVAPQGDYSALDLHDAHDDLEFRLTVTCPADMQGSHSDVPLELHVGGVAVAGGVLPVDCLAAPAPPPRAFAEPAVRQGPPRIVGVVPPAAQAPPALAQSVASAQASSSASSSAHAAQVGMAVAPDDVVQVVTEEAGDDEMRFVGRQRRPAPSPVVPAAFGLAVVVLGLAVRPRVIEQRSRR